MPDLCSEFADARTALADHVAACPQCWRMQLAHPYAYCDVGVRLWRKREDAEDAMVDGPYYTNTLVGAEVIYDGSRATEHGVWIYAGRCHCDWDDCARRFKLKRDGRVLEHVSRGSFFPVDQELVGSVVA